MDFIVQIGLLEPRYSIFQAKHKAKEQSLRALGSPSQADTGLNETRLAVRR